MQELAGKHALVTGGGRGIGAAIALALSAAGARVTITGRDAEAGASAARNSVVRALSPPSSTTSPGPAPRLRSSFISPYCGWLCVVSPFSMRSCWSGLNVVSTPGNTSAPRGSYAIAFSNPAIESAPSRITSASSRKRGPREIIALSISLARFAADAVADCRNAALVTINRVSFFTLQPSFAKRTAR